MLASLLVDEACICINDLQLVTSKNNYDFTVVTNKTICEGWVGALGGSNQVGNLGGVGGVGQGYLGNLFARETLT